MSTHALPTTNVPKSSSQARPVRVHLSSTSCLAHRDAGCAQCRTLEIPCTIRSAGRSCIECNGSAFGDTCSRYNATVAAAAAALNHTSAPAIAATGAPALAVPVATLGRVLDEIEESINIVAFSKASHVGTVTRRSVHERYAEFLKEIPGWDEYEKRHGKFKPVDDK